MRWNILKNPFVIIPVMISIIMIIIELIEYIWIKGRFLLGNFILKRHNKKYIKIFLKINTNIKNYDSKILYVTRRLKTILAILLSAFLYINGAIGSYYIIKLSMLIIFSYFNISNYIIQYTSLTITFTIFMYFPVKIGTWINKFLSNMVTKIFFRKSFIEYNDLLNKIEKYIFKLKPRAWVYLVSVIFTLLGSIEKIYGSNIINFRFWIDIKSVVMESIFTVIVIDGFVNEIKKKN